MTSIIVYLGFTKSDKPEIWVANGTLRVSISTHSNISKTKPSSPTTLKSISPLARGAYDASEKIKQKSLESSTTGENLTAAARPPSANGNLDDIKSEIARIGTDLIFSSTKIRRLDEGNAVELFEDSYLRTWREKCERIGRLNYPIGNIEGQVMAKIEISRSGTLEKVKIVKSSGIPLLDNAVIKTVKQASPFQPFTVEMRKRYDRLEFVRLWKFTKSEKFIDAT